jgi:hypothetical protein
MKNLLTFAACIIVLVACENRRTNDDGSTSKAPDETTSDRDRSYNTDRADDDRDSPVVGTRDKDRDDDGGGLLDGDREAEEKIDASVATAGRTIFMSECASCHRVVDKDKDGVDNDSDKKYAGPALTEITDRRNDRWLMKFMTNTDGRDRTDKDAEDVCRVQVKGKELNRDQALKVLEYLHQRNVRDDAN